MIRNFCNFTIVLKEKNMDGVLSLSDGWDVIRFYSVEDVKKFIEIMKEVETNIQENQNG